MNHKTEFGSLDLRSLLTAWLATQIWLRSWKPPSCHCWWLHFKCSPLSRRPAITAKRGKTCGFSHAWTTEFFSGLDIDGATDVVRLYARRPWLRRLDGKFERQQIFEHPHKTRQLDSRILGFLMAWNWSPRFAFDDWLYVGTHQAIQIALCWAFDG